MDKKDYEREYKEAFMMGYNKSSGENLTWEDLIRAQNEKTLIIKEKLFEYHDKDSIHSGKDLYQLHLTYEHDGQIACINGQFDLEKCYEIHGQLIGEIQNMTMTKVNGLNR